MFRFNVPSTGNTLKKLKKTEVHLQYALLVSDISLVYKYLLKYTMSLLLTDHHNWSTFYSEHR